MRSESDGRRIQERHVNGGALRRRNFGATLGDVGRSKEGQMRHLYKPPQTVAALSQNPESTLKPFER